MKPQRKTPKKKKIRLFVFINGEAVEIPFGKFKTVKLGLNDDRRRIR
jgi:hypothetical protein